MAEPIDKDTRGPVNLRIKFRSESLQQFIERYGVDVSRGGIFIRTREPLPVGTRLKLDFQLVDTAPLFQGDGTVVWIREHDASRAGVTPGMGVRFDRLTPESQTTLDTILEEKIRLQQSGVAPGSIAKAGAGIAVRRPSGAFATLESAGARPGGPPPLPVGVKPGAHPVGAAPVSPMPASSTRSGPLAATSSSSSIFTRPRTTSGMRTVPVPSQLFEAPTADDIDKALSALEEKGDGPPSLPVVPTVINRDDARPIGDDDPTRVFDGSVAEEFAAHDAVTGPATVVPEEDGIPIEAAEGGDGELTERRLVDPASGTISGGGAQNGMTDGKAAKKSRTPAMGGPSKPPPPLDAPLASLVDSGAAPPAKPPTPAPGKPAAAAAPLPKSSSGIPMKISTDRPAATESGRFRSDTRYKRKRGNGLVYALLILVAGGGVAGGGYYYKRQRDKKAAEAIAAAAAAPPLAPAQLEAPPTLPTAPPGTETATGAGGAAATPPENTGAAPEAAGKPAAKPEEAVAKTAIKPDKPGKPTEKATAATDKEGQPAPKSGSGRRKDRGASAPTAAATPAEKPAEAAGEKKPTGEEPKPAADTAKPAEAAKPAEGDKGEKTAEAAKPAEAAPAAPPVLKITSSPTGAEVVIDGVPVGTTPFSSKEISADATHAITVKKDGFESHERMISGSDWARGRGGAQSLKFNVKLKKTGGEAKPAEAGEKKEKPPEVEILTPSEP